MTDVTAAVNQQVRSANAPRPGMLLSIALAAFACVGISLVLGRSATGITPLHAALVSWITLSYVTSGLVAWWRLPESRFGPLMVVTGFSGFVTTLSWSANPVLNTIGVAFDLVPLVLIVHVFLAFPSGRLGGTVERALLATGYVAAIGAQLVVMMLGRPRHRPCPRVRRRAGRSPRHSQHRAHRHQRRCARRRRPARGSAAGRRSAAATIARPASRLVRSRAGDDRGAPAHGSLRRRVIPDDPAHQPRRAGTCADRVPHRAAECPPGAKRGRRTPGRAPSRAG